MCILENVSKEDLPMGVGYCTPSCQCVEFVVKGVAGDRDLWKFLVFGSDNDL